MLRLMGTNASRKDRRRWTYLPRSWRVSYRSSCDSLLTRPYPRARIVSYTSTPGISVQPCSHHTGLNLNIYRPANVSADAKLPVLFVSAFGASEKSVGLSVDAVDLRRRICGWLDCNVSALVMRSSTGANETHRPLHNGTAIVQRSIDIGQPVIYVAVNYR